MTIKGYRFFVCIMDIANYEFYDEKIVHYNY